MVLVETRFASFRLLRRMAKCAVEFGVDIELGPDGRVRVIGSIITDSLAVPAESTKNGEAETQAEAAIKLSDTPTEVPEFATGPPYGHRRLARDYWSLQQMAYELSVSRWTLWRAARSNLPGFPAPHIVSRRIYWRKTELEAIESAMMFFRGRCEFDRQRQAERIATSK